MKYAQLRFLNSLRLIAVIGASALMFMIELSKLFRGEGPLSGTLGMLAVYGVVFAVAIYFLLNDWKIGRKMKAMKGNAILKSDK